MNDADLIQRFIAGQSQAFNTLVWPWQGRLYNLVLRYIGDPEEARDLCQQSFIRAIASYTACATPNASPPGSTRSPPIPAATTCAAANPTSRSTPIRKKTANPIPR